MERPYFIIQCTFDMDEPLLPTNLSELSAEPIASSSSSRHQSSPFPIENIEIASNSSSYVSLIANLKSNATKRRKLGPRSHSAPSVFTGLRGKLDQNSLGPPLPPEANRFLIRQALLGVSVYLSVGIATYLISGSYKGRDTVKPVDGLYYIVVTLCTIGYGDIVPDSTFTKLFTCFYILVGFGFIDVVLNGLVLYICDRQEAVLLSAVDESRFNTMVQTYVVDREKGRMRIRTKVVLASGVVVCCIAVGTVAVHFLEKLSWVDSFYLSVTSVTTVGYGDYAFSTLEGRGFAIVWLLVSTLAVARAFLYLAELRIDKRNRQTAQWVLQKKVTLGDLVAADLDNDGSISKSEFVIFKLKEMGKVAEKDILQICRQFDSLEHNNCGKITFADIMER